MTDRVQRQASPGRCARRDANLMLIATTPLVVTGAFGSGMPAPRVARALGQGLQAGGRPAADLCPLPAGIEEGAIRAGLDALELHERMLRSRAVILGEWLLDQRTLAQTATFELATRARQSGVPAYAVTGENRMNCFDARMLDLQLIVEARSVRALIAAGRKLATVM
jgi:glycerate 2-kinase